MGPRKDPTLMKSLIPLVPTQRTENTLVYQNFASVRASVRATGAGLNFLLDFLNAVLFLTFQSSCCKLRCLGLVVPQGHSQSEATSSQPSMRNMFLESYCL